jgi:hypothetical protein
MAGLILPGDPVVMAGTIEKIKLDQAVDRLLNDPPAVDRMVRTFWKESAGHETARKFVRSMLEAARGW